MRTWLFALLQSTIAAIGLAAFFLAENMLLATAAAVLAASLGVAQPILAARRDRRLQQYQDQQWDRSRAVVDEHLQSLLSAVIEPALPHRPTIAVALRNRFGDRAADLSDQYDQVAAAISNGVSDAETLASRFADDVEHWVAGSYLQGIAALHAGNDASASQYFRTACREHPSWILPWLGWATAAHRQGRWNEIREEHPHICGVELLPYDCGDETTFLQLSEEEREQLSNLFQVAATSLGNYYAIAEYSVSRQQIDVSHEKFRRVA